MENNFGEFLKGKRQEKGLTQKSIAKMLFVTESTVSKWEKNVAHPDITLLPKLASILNVTEHELITASIDNEARAEKKQAKKWRTLAFSWNLFFNISYSVTLLVCFICNLATEKSLSWFWIVFSALMLSFSLTSLPKLIKGHKLLLIPISIYISLCLLLGVCAIYTNGNWFWVASLSVLFGLIVIFAPIYISKYKVFSMIKKYNNFISLFIDFIILNILLIVINNYAVVTYMSDWWYFSLAFPITIVCYLLLNLFLCVRFLKTNKLIKTSLILFMICLIYIAFPLARFGNLTIQKEFDDMNIFRADFSKWVPDETLDNNVHLIIFLTLFTLSLVFLSFGIYKLLKEKNCKNNKKTLQK